MALTYKRKRTRRTTRKRNLLSLFVPTKRNTRKSERNNLIEKRS